MLFEHIALVMGELLALLNMYIAQAGHNPVAWELHLQIVFRERHLHTLRNTVVQNTFAKSIFCKTEILTVYLVIYSYYFLPILKVIL